jgi:hypothetical protein
MNTYDSSEFEQHSKKLKYDLAMQELFGEDVVLNYEFYKFDTPRKTALAKNFSMIPLWYLQFLVDDFPARIVDIGCGDNILKLVIKKLYNLNCYGIDPTPGNQAADEFDFFDSKFSQGHTEAYKSVFSINALHFVPLASLSNQIKEFHNVVAPGGVGFLALNSARMLELSDQKWLVDVFGTDRPEPLQVQNYVSAELAALDIDFLVKDLIIVQVPDEYMDGNIRLVFKK